MTGHRAGQPSRQTFLWTLLEAPETKAANSRLRDAGVGVTVHKERATHANPRRTAPLLRQVMKRPAKVGSPRKGGALQHGKTHDLRAWRPVGLSPAIRFVDTFQEGETKTEIGGRIRSPGTVSVQGVKWRHRSRAEPRELPAEIRNAQRYQQLNTGWCCR